MRIEYIYELFPKRGEWFLGAGWKHGPSIRID